MSKRLLMVLAAMFAALFMVGGVAYAASIQGTEGDDHLKGTAASDRIQGFGGSDFIGGEGDSDELRGGRGADTIKGNADNDEISGGDGRDKISGGAGNDDINSHDSSKDWVDCGPGHNDYVDADRRDVLSGCEDRD